jgi:hypothetical protein
VTPPPFPTSLAELAPWRVYADQLLERGERLGTYLAYELSLGDEPTEAELTSFHKQGLRACRVPRSFEAAWTLGHARTLTIPPRDRGRTMMMRHRGSPVLDGEALPLLRDSFRTPALALLEQLTVTVRGESIGRRWHEAMKFLPASCRRFMVHASAFKEDDPKRVLAGIPEQVKTLRLSTRLGTDPASLISDQFEWVDLRELIITPELAVKLGRALERNPRVKLRLGTVADGEVLTRLGERAVVGGEGDARLVNEKTGAVVLFERASLDSLQRRYGVVAIRAQVGRTLPESFGVTSVDSLVYARSWIGSVLARRANGSWWIRAEEDAPRLALERRPLGREPVELPNAARVFIDDQPWRFAGA